MVLGGATCFLSPCAASLPGVGELRRDLVLLALMLATMLLGMPILLAIALVVTSASRRCRAGVAAVRAKDVRAARFLTLSRCPTSSLPAH